MNASGHYTDGPWSGPNEDPSPEVDDAPATPLPAPRRYRRREAPFPAELQIDASDKPGRQNAWLHGHHSRDIIQIPTAMSCNTCVLFAIKRKNPRSALACPEGRKNQTCSILSRRQLAWAEALIGEIRDATGRDPSATDRARIEQVVRLRSRVFAIEVYVKAAGQIDLRSGELRAVMDRLNSIENALTRSLDGLRSAIADARAARRGGAPSLAEYLEALASRKSAPLAIEDASSKESFTEEQEVLPDEGSDGSE